MRRLRYDAAAPLLAADDPAWVQMARRDLLGGQIPVGSLAGLPGARRVLTRQQPDGRWRYLGRNIFAGAGRQSRYRPGCPGA
jgi:hypothetical protein